MLLFDMMLGKVKIEYTLGMRNYGKPNSYNSTLYLTIYKASWFPSQLFIPRIVIIF